MRRTRLLTLVTSSPYAFSLTILKRSSPLMTRLYVAITLTTFHLAFSTFATQLLAHTTPLLDGRKKVKMTARVYMRAVLPIGFCFSLSLILGNYTYLYLSMSFIQMLKVRTSLQSTLHLVENSLFALPGCHASHCPPRDMEPGPERSTTKHQNLSHCFSYCHRRHDFLH